MYGQMEMAAAFDRAEERQLHRALAASDRARTLDPDLAEVDGAANLVDGKVEEPERAMGESGYPDRRTHAEAHAAFLAELGGLVVQMTGSPLRAVKLWASTACAIAIPRY